MADSLAGLAEPKKPAKFKFPPDHQPGMAVPKGGSSCAVCEYYRGGMTCGNKYFIEWNGSDKIPAQSPDAYCSDWFEPIDGSMNNDNDEDDK